MWRFLRNDRHAEERRRAERKADEAEAGLRRVEQQWPKVNRLAARMEEGLRRNHIAEQLLISIRRTS